MTFCDVSSKPGELDAFRRIERIDRDTYSAFAPAKLNIRLDVKEKVGDIHALSTTMQTVSLCDHLTFRLEKDSAGTRVEGTFIDNNIIAKTMRELSEHIGRNISCTVVLQKSIPESAGMGGGSSDAATVLKLANKALELHMSPIELEQIARRIGNDVPFFIRGGRSDIKEDGREQKISPEVVPKHYYAIARPNLKLSTRELFSLLDETGKNFETLASERCEDTRKLLELVRTAKTKPIESGITGKGPTVFASYNTYEYSAEIAKKMQWLNGSDKQFDGEIFIARSMKASIGIFSPK